MKYLKRFNESNQEFYYQVDGINKDNKRRISMDRSIISQIESRLLPIFYIKPELYMTNPNDRYFFEPPMKFDDIYASIYYTGDFYVDIFPLDDEYFDVEILDTRLEQYGKTRFNSVYYRCDQLEGLLKFLKDENIIS